MGDYEGAPSALPLILGQVAHCKALGGQRKTRGHSPPALNAACCALQVLRIGRVLSRIMRIMRVSRTIRLVKSAKSLKVPSLVIPPL